MNELLENIGSILSNVINWLGQMASSLITNPIFVLIMAVIILRILYYSIKLIILEIKIKRSEGKYEFWRDYSIGGKK